MSQITRCPHCATTFKVVADQLRISDGWVRCGQCKQVFDATECMLSSMPLSQASSGDDVDARSATAVSQPPELPELPELPSGAPPSAMPEEVGQHRALEESADQPVSVSALLVERAPLIEGGSHAVGDDTGRETAGQAIDHDDGADRVEADLSPAPLSALLRHEASPDAQMDGAPIAPAVVGYELPGASEEDSSWPDDALDAAETAADAASPEARHDGPKELPGATESGSDEERDQGAAALDGLESLSPEPIPVEEAVVLPAEALLDGPQAAPDTSGDEPSFVTSARRNAVWQRPGVRAALGLAALCLALLLGLQVALQERDAIAARSPNAHALMVRICAVLQCTLEPPRRIDAVVIDSSSFVKARDDAQTYQLKVGVRNNSTLAVAMPALELTLTDAHDQTLLRRVLLREELGAPVQLEPGASWSATLPVLVTQDAAQVAGYRVLAFYP